ncbi:MAG: BamA/TamA family outer membrane protein [Cyclobacteriaceae bacterium]|nr:BamA/TamA family outer membrane protein [Cyclobacteriaceae bacterium]
MRFTFIHILFIFSGMLTFGCAGTKRLPEGKSLYTGAEVEFQDKAVRDRKKVQKSLEKLLAPEPNAAIFGMRPKLWLHNKIGELDKKKGFKHWLKTRLGEPPVFYEDVRVEQVNEQLEYRLVNHGFFDARVSPEIIDKKRETSVIYKVTPGKPYLIREIHYPDSNNILNRIIAAQKPAGVIKPGNRFDVEMMARERKRVEEVARDSGYYYFNGTHLIFDADSTVGDHEVDLFLRRKENIPPKAFQRFKISEIRIFPGYSSDTTKLGDPVKIDSMLYFIDPDEIRPRPVANAIKMGVGDFYSAEDEDITFSRLAGLGIFRYVNLNFEEDTVNRLLRARINLAPYKKKSVRLQLNAVSKSNNFVGPFLTLTFLNRNFLGGGEEFEISLNTGFEAQINSSQPGIFNAWEVGLNTALTVPRLIIPFHFNESDSKYDFETKFQVGGRSQRRVGYFDLISLDLSTGYLWNKKVIHRHHLFPVNINFFKLGQTSQEFRDLLEANPFMQSAYQDQFILGGRYSYFYNSKAIEGQLENNNNFYFNANFNTSGNVVNLLQQAITKSPENGEENTYNLLGAPYAQFTKFDFDFRYYYRIDAKHRLAARLIAGIGYPYGNSIEMPYTHQFAVGGSSSIRAFRPRSVGPGEYILPDSLMESNAFIDQTADIKLEMNFEYRFDLFGNFKGAVFVDAGNIWSLNVEETRPGGDFQFNRFWKQIAIGTGIGIRYDVDFLIVRLDVGTPVRIPYGPESDRWVIGDVAIDQKSWRKQNMIFNIAIGYPF